MGTTVGELRAHALAVPPAGAPAGPGRRLVRVVVAEENAVLRYGLLALLASAPEVEVVAEARGVVEGTVLTKALAPDVLLLGVRGADFGRDMLPLTEGVTKVIIFADTDDPSTVVAAVAAGASSYLVHGQVEQSQIVEAVRGAASGLSFLSPSAAAALVGQLQSGPEAGPAARAELTPREREVMELIAVGLTNQQIAARLVISGKTVKNHVHHVYKRLRVDNREQAVARWRQLCSGQKSDLPAVRSRGVHRSDHC